MARPRSPGYDDQRALILRRAAELFAQHGYAGTSMNQVASACCVSKAALYHYVRDKGELLAQVVESHMTRLAQVVQEVQAQHHAGETELRELIKRFVNEYANARHEHRVLTEDVDQLEPQRRAQVLDVQRQVVNAFANAVAKARPELQQDELHKPLTMLLFGMINWMFTWFKSGQPLSHADMAPMVADLFLGGLGAVRAPQPDCSDSAPPRPASERRPSTPKETSR